MIVSIWDLRPLRGTRATVSQPSLGKRSNQLLRAPEFLRPVVAIRRPLAQSKGTERGRFETASRYSRPARAAASHPSLGEGANQLV